MLAKSFLQPQTPPLSASFSDGGAPREILESGIYDDFLTNLMADQLISQLPKQLRGATGLQRNRFPRDVG